MKNLRTRLNFIKAIINILPAKTTAKTVNVFRYGVGETSSVIPPPDSSKGVIGGCGSMTPSTTD
ncbi:MAG: hypothetical protein N3H84_07705 [Candidatus Caldarchaeum sp.]|nr:hypothetical protein [Candidatus Caldarchaeum sp.]